MNIRKESMFVCAWSVLVVGMVDPSVYCVAGLEGRVRALCTARPPAHTQLNRKLYFDILCILYYCLKLAL